MTVVAAAIIRRERDLVARFVAAGATSPTTARTLAEIGADPGLTLDRLKRRAVVREASPGLYYIDEPSWIALRSLGRRLALVVLGIAFALLATAAIVMLLR